MSQSTLHATLRRATADAHSRVDAAVGGGIADETGYACYLRGLHDFLACSHDALGPAWSLQPLQALLLDDMEAMGVRPATGPGIEVAVAVDDITRLGWAYVVAGSSVGARQLVRQAEALGSRAAPATAFLRRFAHSPMWPGVLSALEAARLDFPQTERLREAALAAFATAEAAFQRAGDQSTDE